jgi:hypothetical protein
VEVRVYYLNAEGRRVGEYDRAVVSVSQMMFGDDSPLRPGYERDFDFPAANAPGSWDRHSVDIAVISVRHEGDSASTPVEGPVTEVRRTGDDILTG